jgi:hypothetical protein
MCVDVMVKTGGAIVTGARGVGSWIGEDGGVLRKVDGNRLETEDMVEFDGDGGDGSCDDCLDGRWDETVGAIRGRKRPPLARLSEARVWCIDGLSGDGGQRYVS